jgi:hypothetical protein
MGTSRTVGKERSPLQKDLLTAPNLKGTSMAIQQTREYEATPVAIAHELAKSPRKLKIWRAVYAGGKRPKTARDLETQTGLTSQIILALATPMAAKGYFERVELEGFWAYKKIDSLNAVKHEILRMAGSTSALDRAEAKKLRVTAVTIRTARDRNGKARYLSVDSIDQFSRTKSVRNTAPLPALPEAKFKNGLKRIFQETRDFPDWPGERNDFYTDKLKISGRRYPAAFALKGPGIRVRKAVPGKWGKQGNQIQRLAASPAQVLMLQFEGEIDEYSREQLTKLAQLRAHQEKENIFFGFIDDADSARLRRAYPHAFR